MKTSDALEIFLVATPGLESVVAAEATEHGFEVASSVAGGVTLTGSWTEVWRANLTLRCPTRVLVRMGTMRVTHLAQLDKQARRLPWDQFLRADVPVRVDASCSRSRIYHSGAAAQRIATAIGQGLGAPVTTDADLRLMIRIENNICTVSIDTSGELLHKRGYKPAVGKAPLRETLAALFLRSCGFTGEEPVLDPMCGSGTLVIEAAEMALGLLPGRQRQFGFEQLTSFDAGKWDALRTNLRPRDTSFRFSGADQDPGAIRMSRENAERAGVVAVTDFNPYALDDLPRPDGPPGLVMVNPPYGARIGDPRRVRALYAALGRRLLEHFSGWRVGLITSDPPLAQASRLPFQRPGPPVPHGKLRIRLFQTDPLP